MICSEAGHRPSRCPCLRDVLKEGFFSGGGGGGGHSHDDDDESARVKNQASQTPVPPVPLTRANGRPDPSNSSRHP